MRDAADSLEVLLLRRSHHSGFAPEAYVFPGGRLDPTDASAAMLERVDGLTRDQAAARLDLLDADPPAIAYYLAALREAFEEAGIVLGVRHDGSPPATAAENAYVDRIREDLMEDRIDFAEALERMECRVAGGAIEYVAHWITPEASPTRFDTRFFAAPVRGGTTPIVDPREMTDALWTTPARALEETAQGSLPMILPTVRTLERLVGYDGTQEALAALALESVPTIMPKSDALGNRERPGDER